VLYPLSYTGIIPVAGFEPASTRVRGEVTLVFTTGRIFVLRTHIRTCGGSVFASPPSRFNLPRTRVSAPQYLLAREQKVTEGLAP
jgi:hypothetical protein